MKRYTIPRTAHCEGGALAMTKWGTGKPKPTHILQAIVGDATCTHCLNPKDSQLHHELCEVTGTPPPRVPEHGTNSGYQRHLKDHTPACGPCREAHAALNRAKRARRAA